MALLLKPITLKQAKEFIECLHRHHRPPVGHKFSIGVEKEDTLKLVGVAVAGRPVARGLDDGYTCEVTRVCTDGTKNTCSMLYGACWRAAKAMGYRRIFTYTLDAESGSSLKAAGWRKDAMVKGRSWSCPSRPREDKHPTCDKIRWACP